MKIDKFNLYLVMAIVLGAETGYYDGTAHLNGAWQFFGLGPEGIVGMCVVRFFGWWLWRKDSS